MCFIVFKYLLHFIQIKPIQVKVFSLGIIKQFSLNNTQLDSNLFPQTIELANPVLANTYLIRAMHLWAECHWLGLQFTLMMH